MSTADSASYVLAGAAIIGGFAAAGFDVVRRRQSIDPPLLMDAISSPNTRPTVDVSLAAGPDGRVVWRVESHAHEPIVIDIFSYRNIDSTTPEWHHDLIDHSPELRPRHRHLWPALPVFDRSSVFVGWRSPTGHTESTWLVVERPRDVN